MSIKEQVYQDLKNMFAEESSGITGIQPNEIFGLLTKDLSIPEHYGIVQLDMKFRELLDYGSKLSVLKNFIEEKKSYYKFVFDNKKEDMKHNNRNYHNGQLKKEEIDNLQLNYQNIYEEYGAWQFFYKLAYDKWGLLDVVLGHIRTRITLLREGVKRGIENAEG